MKPPVKIILPSLLIIITLIIMGLFLAAPYIWFSPNQCVWSAPSNNSQGPDQYNNPFGGEPPKLVQTLNQQDVTHIVEMLIQKIPFEEGQSAVYAGYISTLPGISYRKAWKIDTPNHTPNWGQSEIPLDDFIDAWSSPPSLALPARVYNISFFGERYGFICVRLEARNNHGAIAGTRGGFGEMWVFHQAFWVPQGWEFIRKEVIFTKD